MIDLSLFNLVYKRITDQRVFLCRIVTKLDFVLIDTVSGEVVRMTEAKVKRRYRPVKELNRLNKKRPPFMNYGSRRTA